MRRHLVHMPGVHVLHVTWREPSTTLPGRLRLVVESELAETDCPSGGVICTTLRAASPWTHSSTALEVGEQPAA
jgi:hypothetical protein